VADDIASLIIEIDSKGVVKASGNLSRLEKQSKKNEKANKTLNKSNKDVKGGFIAIAAAVGSLTIAYKAMGGIISNTAQFQKLNASLETVTGSSEAAARAFKDITKFAGETPFQITELTEAFIKLKALGLDPSEQAIKSYGNTASAMGKSLNQMIEAVADASTMEFERLKEFGIKARQTANEVSFTFQGVTTSVGKNSQEIQDYLLGIGEVQFAGAMERQMDTLNGAFSNFSDSISVLAAGIGESGIGAAIQDLVNKSTSLIKNFNLLFDDGA